MGGDKGGEQSPPDGMTPPTTLARRLHIYGSCCLHSLCCSGIFHGWSGMKLIIEREGLFRHLCSPADGLMCEARSAKLVSIYSTAFGFSTAGYVVGAALMDVAGPRWTNVVSLSMSALALLVLSSNITSSSSWPPVSFGPLSIDWFSVAYSLLSLSGTMAQTSSVHSSNVLPPIWRRLAVTSFSALFAIGSLVFVMMNIISGSLGVPPSLLLRVWMCVEALLAVNAAVVMPDRPCQALGASKKERDEAEKKIPYRQLLGSHHFWFMAVFPACGLTTCVFWLSTYQDWLVELGDLDRRLSTSSGLIIPAGPFLNPLFGLLLVRMGLKTGLVVLNCGIALLLLLSRTRSLALQWVSVGVYAVCRPCVGSMTYAMVAALFGLPSFSRVFGTSSFIVGVVSSLVAPQLRHLAAATSLPHVYGCLLFASLLLYIPLLLPLDGPRPSEPHEGKKER